MEAGYSSEKIFVNLRSYTMSKLRLLTFDKLRLLQHILGHVNPSPLTLHVDEFTFFLRAPLLHLYNLPSCSITGS